MTPGKASGLGNRWVQLLVGITCMVMIANLQYGWTLFVNPIAAKCNTVERGPRGVEA